MSDAVRAEKIAHEVDYAARQLAQAGRLDLTREFIQHGDVTVYAHVTSVARASLSFAERLGRAGISVDRASLLRGALLHDYFLYDWHDPDPSHRLHGFRHPFFALARAEEDFELTPRERNIIVRHMFPLVPVPPTCREAWIVCLADKWCALHGRICLYWACAFGLGALCICRLVEPALLGLLGHLPVLIVRLSAFIVAVAMMVDAVCSLASWRRLSDQLECVRADLADRINESLADASDSMLERIPDSAIDSVAQTHIRSRAVNAWLAELGDVTLDALREKASMPTFISDGARGLALAARRVADAAPSMPRPSLSRRLAGKRMSRPVPSVSLSRRDLRFFNAFPRLRINRYEGVIRATNLRDRAHELFRR